MSGVSCSFDELMDSKFEMGQNLNELAKNINFSSFQQKYQVLKRCVGEQEIMNRLKKFFPYGQHIELGKQNVHGRKQANYGNGHIHPIGNEIILFGIDFCSKKEIKRKYQPNKIQFINFSNIKLIYQNNEDAWKAILANAKDVTQIAKKMQADSQYLPQNWFEMNPYITAKCQTHIFARFATTEERTIRLQEQDKEQLLNLSKEIFNEKEQSINEMSVLDSLNKANIRILREERQISKMRLVKQFQSDIPCNRSQKGRQRSRSRDFNRSFAESNCHKQNKDLSIQANFSFLYQKSNLNTNDLELNNSTHPTAKMNQLYDKQMIQEINKCMVVEHCDKSLDFSHISQISMGQSQNKRSEKSNIGLLTTKWSYSQYMKQKEEEEQSIRIKQKKIVQIITLD